MIIKFPRQGSSFVARKIIGNISGRQEPLPTQVLGNKNLCHVEVTLDDAVDVTGYGMPFAAPFGHPSDGWIKKNEPIFGTTTLLDIFGQKTFHLIVKADEKIAREALRMDTLPPPFGYPYGEKHEWDPNKYSKLLKDTAGDQFEPAHNFRDDNAHLAAMTQSTVQDIWWVHEAGKAIAEIVFKAYFVEKTPGDSKAYHVILPVTEIFKKTYQEAWRRLTTCPLELWIESDDEGGPAKWLVDLTDNPKGIEALKGHDIKSDVDLVLYARRPHVKDEQRRPDFEVKTFGDRETAKEAVKSDPTR